jgi:hypothetical protein
LGFIWISLSGLKFELEFKFESSSLYRGKLGKTFLPPGGPTTPLSAQLPFWPAVAQQPNRRPPPTTRRTPPLISGARAASRWRHADVAVVTSFFIALAEAKAKARPCRSWPPSRRAPRPSSASQPSTYPALPAAIRNRRHNPLSSPNPSRLGGTRSPVHTPVRRRRRRSWWGEGGVGGSPWECRPLRRSEPPVGRADPAVVKRAYFHYLHVAAPPSSSSSPTSCAAFLHQRLHYGPWRPR